MKILLFLCLTILLIVIAKMVWVAIMTKNTDGHFEKAELSFGESRYVPGRFG